jgi:hypothetical protein
MWKNAPTGSNGSRDGLDRHLQSQAFALDSGLCESDSMREPLAYCTALVKLNRLSS